MAKVTVVDNVKFIPTIGDLVKINKPIKGIGLVIHLPDNNKYEILVLKVNKNSSKIKAFNTIIVNMNDVDYYNKTVILQN